MTGIRRERFGDFSVVHREPEGKAVATVHFAHATGFNAETYRELFRDLDPALDVYAMDARGHGFSRADADPSRLRSWAPFRRDLEAFVQTLARPVILAGHSMGATVSMELAAARPELVRGLVLADPVIVPPKRVLVLALARFFGLSGRLIPIARLAARRRTEFSSKEAAIENYLGKGPFKTWPREWIAAYVDGGTVPTDKGTVRLSCDREWESKTFATSIVSPYRALRRVRCPITLIAREHDAPPFTRASRHAFIRCQPRTRVITLEEASHFMTMEHPEIVRTEIERMAGATSELR